MTYASPTNDYFPNMNFSFLNYVVEVSTSYLLIDLVGLHF
jgi:hypothetical protein